MQNEDREIRLGQTRLYLGQDNICYVTVVGEVDEKIALGIKEADLRFKNMVGKIDVLADLNKAGKQSSGARKIWNELAEDDRTGKIAIFGMHPVARVLASFVMGVSKKKDMRFFRTKEEALAWLEE